MTSGASAAIIREFLLAAAVPKLAASSSALPGLFNIFFPTILAAFPTERKKSPNPSACIVWSETIRDLFLLQVEQVPLNSLFGNSGF